MLEDFTTYKEKIENKENKINELKEELKQLEKNIEANNRIFMRKYQKNSKPTKKNMFLFHSSRTGNNTNKKQEIIIYKNNKNLKSLERKKAKSTPKVSKFTSINKNNNYFYSNSGKKNFNFNFYGTNRGKTLDYKNNKLNLNNIKNKIGQNISNNLKQIKINNETSQELKLENDLNNNTNTNTNKASNKYNKTEPNYIINIINNFDNNYYNNLNDKIKNNIFVNKSITNASSQNSYNNSKINNRKDNNNNKDNPTKIKDNYFFDVDKNDTKQLNEDVYKNIEKRIESVFDKYFSYFKNNRSLKVNKNNQNKKE